MWSEPFIGCIYHQPTDEAETERDLTAAELREIGRRQDLNGAPVLINHNPSRRAGRVEKILYDAADNSAFAVFKVRKDTPHGQEALSGIHKGVFKDLSLSHWKNSKRGIEVSVCEEGARKNTRIIRASKNPENVGIKRLSPTDAQALDADSRFETIISASSASDTDSTMSVPAANNTPVFTPSQMDFVMKGIENALRSQSERQVAPGTVNITNTPLGEAHNSAPSLVPPPDLGKDAKVRQLAEQLVREFAGSQTNPVIPPASFGQPQQQAPVSSLSSLPPPAAAPQPPQAAPSSQPLAQPPASQTPSEGKQEKEDQKEEKNTGKEEVTPGEEEAGAKRGKKRAAEDEEPDVALALYRAKELMNSLSQKKGKVSEDEVFNTMKEMQGLTNLITHLSAKLDDGQVNERRTLLRQSLSNIIKGVDNPEVIKKAAEVENLITYSKRTSSDAVARAFSDLTTLVEKHRPASSASSSSSSASSNQGRPTFSAPHPFANFPPPPGQPNASQRAQTMSEQDRWNAFQQSLQQQGLPSYPPAQAPPPPMMSAPYPYGYPPMNYPPHPYGMPGTDSKIQSSANPESGPDEKIEMSRAVQEDQFLDQFVNYDKMPLVTGEQRLGVAADVARTTAFIRKQPLAYDPSVGPRFIYNKSADQEQVLPGY